MTIKNRDSVDETFEELVARCMKERQEDLDNECRLLISVNDVEMGVRRLRLEHYEFHKPVRNQTDKCRGQGTEGKVIHSVEPASGRFSSQHTLEVSLASTEARHVSKNSACHLNSQEGSTSGRDSAWLNICISMYSVDTFHKPD